VENALLSVGGKPFDLQLDTKREREDQANHTDEKYGYVLFTDWYDSSCTGSA